MTIFCLMVSMLNLVLCNHSGYSAEEHRENLQELKVKNQKSTFHSRKLSVITAAWLAQLVERQSAVREV